MKNYYLLIVLTVLFYSCERQQTQQPEQEKAYHFKDGLVIRGFREESCQNGKLDMMLHNFAIKWEESLMDKTMALPAEELNKQGIQSFHKAMAVHTLVRGSKYRRVKRIFNALVKHTNRLDIKYNVSLVRHMKNPDIINAWVTARGDIFISEAMLDFVGSEDELAFIIAHELSHIENLLPDKRIAFHNYIMDLDATQSKLFGNMATSLLSSLMVSLNQYDELIADRAALYLMNEAKYNPEAALDFFFKLDIAGEDNKSYLVFETLTNTHPYDHVRFNCLSRYLHESKYRVPIEENEIVPKAASNGLTWN